MLIAQTGQLLLAADFVLDFRCFETAALNLFLLLDVILKENRY